MHIRFTVLFATSITLHVAKNFGKIWLKFAYNFYTKIWCQNLNTVFAPMLPSHAFQTLYLSKQDVSLCLCLERPPLHRSEVVGHPAREIFLLLRWHASSSSRTYKPTTIGNRTMFLKYAHRRKRLMKTTPKNTQNNIRCTLTHAAKKNSAGGTFI